MEQRPSAIPIVVLDTETTGLNPALGHRVVEIGAVRLEDGKTVAEFSQLIYPDRLMDAKASAVNGISDADLRGQPRFAEIAPELLRLLDGAMLVAHNAVFDAGFIGQELFISGYAPDPALQQPVLPNPWLCTLTLARNFFYFGSNSLGNIARTLGVRMGQAHRALADVYMTAEIFTRMTRELAHKYDLHTVGDLLHAQDGAIYTPPPPQLFLPPVIQEALRNGRNLHILYITPQHGESRRTITPLYPTETNGVGYLVAYCHLRREQRTFRLDRIFSAELG
ncbi:MAG: WYL domain-containing protein [Ardenticatenaceae bacterium]|nr:WYL domain-containing protein [Ardenticatenaceae bacterium]